MKEDDYEFEMLLNEIPHATSSFHTQHHGDGDGNDSNFSKMRRPHDGMFHDDDPFTYQTSPVSGYSQGDSTSSSSSSFSGWFSSSDDGGSPTTPFESHILHRNTHGSYNGVRLESKLQDGLPLRNNAGQDLVSRMGRMQIRDEVDVSPMIEQQFQPHNLYGFQSSDSPIRFRTNNGNVEKTRLFQNSRNMVSDPGLVQHPIPVSSKSFNGDMRSTLPGLQQGCQMGNLLGFPTLFDQYNSLCPYQAQCVNPAGFARKHVSNDVLLSKFQPNLDNDATGGNCYGRRVQSPYVTRSLSIHDNFFMSQQNQMGFSGKGGIYAPQGSSHTMLPNVSLGMNNLPSNSDPMYSANGVTKNGWAPQSLPSRRGAWDLEACKCEDGLIIQGRSLDDLINKRFDCSNEHKNVSFNETHTACSLEKHVKLNYQCCCRGSPVGNCGIVTDPKTCSPLLLPLKYSSLFDVKGHIYYMAKDQHACRLLQQKFDEGTLQEVQMMFHELIGHVPELMTNPFGNYLVQKLLEVCNDDQRMQMLVMIASEPGKLVKISLNMHGTRVVQKLIGTLKTRQQISLVVSALKPGFFDLIMDLNGNHVIQRCLQCLSNEDNKFIFDAAAKFCGDIAIHRHGCCVLQRCIGYSTGDNRENLVAKVSCKGYELAKDPYGNYVIQYILKLKIPSAIAILISQFEGKYVELSQNKFSSNVVEKCLEAFEEKGQLTIINELISFSQIDQLLQHPFANYVIQAALVISKGHLRGSLVEAIRPHATILRTSPYCKRIFSRTFLKK